MRRPPREPQSARQWHWQHRRGDSPKRRKGTAHPGDGADGGANRPEGRLLALSHAAQPPRCHSVRGPNLTREMRA